MQLEDAEADAFFAEIDTDGDGFITRAELIVYIKAGRHRGAGQ